MKRHSRTTDIHFTRWLFRFYLLLLFLAPLPLGSNRPLFWSILVFATALIALVWSVGWLLGAAHWPQAIGRAKLPLIALGSFLALAILQLLPPDWVPNFAIPTFIYDAYAVTAPKAGLSIDASSSSDSLLFSLGLALITILTLLLVRSKRRVLQLLFTLTLAGLLQALYGSLMVLSGVEYGFFEVKEYGRGVATGTFINRNHFANLLVLALSAGTGLLLAQMNLQGSENMRERLRSLLQAALGPKARLRIYMIVTVIALVLTRSRMGNLSFFAALTMVGVIALWRLNTPSRPLVVLVVSVLVIDIFMVGTWFGMEKVVDRMRQSVQIEQDEWSIKDKNRSNANREALNIISLSPVTGMGGGSFYTVYPAWRGNDQKFMDHTHNDYLEFAIDYGLVGLILLAWFMTLCMLRAVRGLKRRDKPQQFGISFASLMAMVAMMIHAFVDFSLHIPANAVWFMVLCILPYCLRGLSRHNSAEARLE